MGGLKPYLYIEFKYSLLESNLLEIFLLDLWNSLRKNVCLSIRIRIVILFVTDKLTFDRSSQLGGIHKPREQLWIYFFADQGWELRVIKMDFKYKSLSIIVHIKTTIIYLWDLVSNDKFQIWNPPKFIEFLFNTSPSASWNWTPSEILWLAV